MQTVIQRARPLLLLALHTDGRGASSFDPSLMAMTTTGNAFCHVVGSMARRMFVCYLACKKICPRSQPAALRPTCAATKSQASSSLVDFTCLLQMGHEEVLDHIPKPRVL